jgi:hypothetical protein
MDREGQRQAGAAHRELRLGHRRQPLGAGITIFTDPRIARLITLIRTALRPARGAGRIALVQTLGALCHTAFAAGVLAMILAMFFGLSESLGTVPWPWAVLANAALIVQFPLIHFLLFTGPGGWLLARLILGPYEATWPQPPMPSSPRPSFWRCLRCGHHLVSGRRGSVLGNAPAPMPQAG